MGDIRNKPIRDKIRTKRLGAKGPLYVPPELKEEGWEYRWEATSDNNPYSLMEAHRNGWQHVPVEHLQRINDFLGDGSITNSFTEGSYICTGSGAGTKSYLMRIPTSDYLENKEIERKEILRNQSRITEEQLEKPGVYKNKDLYEKED